MKKRTWALAAAVSLVLALALSYGAAWLLMPPRQSYGAAWESYLQEDRDSVDVLFFGSSLVYCNIVPGVIWERSGVTTFLAAGPEQTIPTTYHYIREACRTQHPKVVAVEVTGMFYPRYTNYTKANLLYMPWSLDRLQATAVGAEREVRADCLFPILEFHSRWKDVTAGEIRTHLFPETDPFAGYTFLDQGRFPGEMNYRTEFTAQGENYRRNLAYLEKIDRYCREEGMDLLLFVTPAVSRIPPEALAALREDIGGLSAVFMDFNEIVDQLDVDDRTDWYDNLHFNCIGAEKFSRYLADYLTGELGLVPTQGEDETLWQSRADTFQAQRAAAVIDPAAADAASPQGALG